MTDKTQERAEAATPTVEQSPRNYGLAFGKIMQRHPKADVRLVNDILREAFAESIAVEQSGPLDVERIASDLLFNFGLEYRIDRAAFTEQLRASLVPQPARPATTEELHRRIDQGKAEVGPARPADTALREALDLLDENTDALSGWVREYEDDEAADRIIEEWKQVRAALAEQPTSSEQDHEHDFVNPRNEVVQDNGWLVCRICGKLQPPESQP